MYNEFECLINKKLIAPSVLSVDVITITLETETSTITMIAVGECCSHSWVEHFDSIPTGETIKSVITKEVERIDDDAEHDCLQKYFYEIVTDKGSYTIEMRNSSNGYYGGEFDIKEEMKL